jgi:hypothetical protein
MGWHGYCLLTRQTLEQTMTRALPFVFLALLACDDPNDTGDSAWPYCEDAETIITPDETTPLGVTGADLVDSLPQSAEAGIAWSGGDSGTLSWGFSADAATLRFVESTEVYPEPEPGQMVPDIAVDCPDYVAIDGVLNLQSDDGQLNEAIALTITLDEYSLDDMSAGFFAELDQDTLGGTLDLSDYLDESAYDAVRVFLSGEIVGGTLSGELSAQGEGTSGDMAFAENIIIATINGE